MAHQGKCRKAEGKNSLLIANKEKMEVQGFSYFNGYGNNLFFFSQSFCVSLCKRKLKPSYKRMPILSCPPRVRHTGSQSLTWKCSEDLFSFKNIKKLVEKVKITILWSWGCLGASNSFHPSSCRYTAGFHSCHDCEAACF